MLDQEPPAEKPLGGAVIRRLAHAQARQLCARAETRPPLLITLSGPSGVGKDAVLQRMRETDQPFHFTVTCTTRAMRPGERHGVDYFFLSPEEFTAMLERGEFLEWANVYGNYYGVPCEQVRNALARGRDVIVKADVQGAATIKRLVPQTVLIFLAPPSLGVLEARLARRKTESSTELAVRIETAIDEMTWLPMFDYVVVNEDQRLGLTVARIQAIVTSEKCRVIPRIAVV